MQEAVVGDANFKIRIHVNRGTKKEHCGLGFHVFDRKVKSRSAWFDVLFTFLGPTTINPGSTGIFGCSSEDRRSAKTGWWTRLRCTKAEVGLTYELCVAQCIRFRVWQIASNTEEPYQVIMFNWRDIRSFSCCIQRSCSKCFWSSSCLYSEPSCWSCGRRIAARHANNCLTSRHMPACRLSWSLFQIL